MTAREYLNRALYLRLQIQIQDERAEEIRHRMQSVGAIRYDKLNVQSSPTDPMLENIARLMEAEQEALRLSAQLADVYKEICNKLEQMDNELFRTILTYRYLHNMTLRKIAERVHYSEGYVRILHTAALKAFDKLIA